jgi:hypothetical protein
MSVCLGPRRCARALLTSGEVALPEAFRRKPSSDINGLVPRRPFSSDAFTHPSKSSTFPVMLSFTLSLGEY